MVQAFFAAVLTQSRRANLMSVGHFSADATLVEAWASHRSFQPEDAPTPPTDDDPGNPTMDFLGETRSNARHQSTTDPEA